MRQSRRARWHRPASSGDSAREAHAVELAGLRRETNLDIAHTLAIRELGKGHDAKLFGARERSHATVAVVALHNALQGRPGQEVRDLG